jgi:predicted Zn-dependent peptidase
MGALKREEIQNGIYFNTISDERFKSNKLAVHFILPLKEETAAVNALLPNLLRKGCRRFADFTVFNRHLDGLYGAAVGSDVEKFGDYQVLSLSIVGIDDQYTLSGEPVLSELSEILSELILEPVLENGAFLQHEVEIEKKTLIDTILAELNDKRTYAVNTATRLMCQGEPYGLSPYGTVEEVKALTPPYVYEAYQTLLKTARIEIMFVGGGDASVPKKILSEKFSQLSREVLSLVSLKTHKVPEKEETVTERMDVSQSKMVLGFSTGLLARDEKIPAMRVMTAIFGGTPMSKLFLNVREKMSLCYYCAARLDRTKGILKVDCGVENQNIDKAKNEILHQLEEMKAGIISDEEISNAVMSLVNSYKTIYDAPGAVEGFYLGQVLTGEAASPDEEAQRLSAVTKEDIVDAAKLVHLDLSYVLTGKEEK